MSVKLISVKCPECGAALDIEQGRTQCFCSYCGTKILIHDDNEYIIRKIDEAELKRAETDQKIQLKQLEIKEKTRQSKIIISSILVTVGILMMTLGFLLGKATGDPDSGFFMISLVGMFPLIGALAVWS